MWHKPQYLRFREIENKSLLLWSSNHTPVASFISLAQCFCEIQKALQPNISTFIQLVLSYFLAIGPQQILRIPRQLFCTKCVATFVAMLSLQSILQLPQYFSWEQKIISEMGSSMYCRNMRRRNTMPRICLPVEESFHELFVLPQCNPVITSPSCMQIRVIIYEIPNPSAHGIITRLSKHFDIWYDMMIWYKIWYEMVYMILIYDAIYDMNDMIWCDMIWYCKRYCI